MQRDIKTLSGIMNLDDSNEIIPSSHHKEARNGVFKGEASELRFTAIRGNFKVTNGSIPSSDCKLSGTASFVPSCDMAGIAVKTSDCTLAGTAVLQVNFNISVTCSLNDGTVLINGITGGSGVYQIGNQAYATEAIALASTSFVDGTSLTFNNMPDATLWYVVRDKNNPSNKFAKSAVVECNGTSTECRTGATITIGNGGAEVFYQDCCGNPRSTMYPSAGTYQLNVCIKAGSFSSPDPGFIGFTYFAQTCIASTAAEWVNQGYSSCYNCAVGIVYKDINMCSSTYNQYKVGSTVVGTTPPTPGSCNVNPNWVLTGYNTCSSCITYVVYKDNSSCSPTYNQYRVNGTVVGYTEPTRGSCNYTANWVNEGARICIDCTSYQPQRDITLCSSTYNNTRNSDGIYGAAPCNTTTPSYITYEGLYHYCSSGVVYTAPVYSNTNVCYSGVSTAQYRVDFGGGNYVYYGVGNNPVNAYPDTSPNWYVRPIEVYWECDGTTKYYQEIDMNICSPTGGQTRRGSLYATNSTDCGYVPIECNSYEIYNPDMNYDANYDYEACGGGMVYDTLGPNMTIVVCAATWPVTTGVVTPLGSCSV